MRGRDVSRPGFAGARVDPRKDKESQKEGMEEVEGDRSICKIETVLVKGKGSKIVRGPNTVDNQTKEMTEVYTPIQQCGWTPACIEY